MATVEIASHVFLVEFHVYFYHLLDALPDYDIPKLEGASDGASLLERETIEVEISKEDGSIQVHRGIEFPRQFTDVLEFYLWDNEPVFFPSYEYHIMSSNGCMLKHVILQTSHNGNPVLVIFPELMFNVELGEIRGIHWKTSRGFSYRIDCVDVLPMMKSVHTSSVNLPTVNGLRKAIRKPTGIDLRPKCLAVINQGDLGTCGVSSLVCMLEAVTETRLSVLFLYYTTRKLMGRLPCDDSGVELIDCLEALEKYGICREELWPYDNICKFCEEPPPEAYKEAAHFRPSSEICQIYSLEEMKDCLNHELPFSCDIEFPPKFFGREVAKTGQAPPPSTIVDFCDHTVLVVGYDDDTSEFIYQNSWGTTWGTGGFGHFPYSYITQNQFKSAYCWRGKRRNPFIVSNLK